MFAHNPFFRDEPILIVGAGPSGLMLAILSELYGIPYKIIEKKADARIMHTKQIGAGICLPSNTLELLRIYCPDLEATIKKIAHRVHNIIYTKPSGDIFFNASLDESPLDQNWFVALHRESLYEALVDKIKSAIYFSTEIDTIEQNEYGVFVKFKNDNVIEKFSVLVAADGVHSAIREKVFHNNVAREFDINVWRWTCQYATKDLQPTYMFDQGKVFMSYPIGENEVYCYAHLVNNESSQTVVDHRRAVHDIFSHCGGIVSEMLTHLPTSIHYGKILSVEEPVLYDGNRIVFIGDASHACNPTLQQGFAGATEDAIALSELLIKFPLKKALTFYQEFRTPRVNSVVELSNAPLKTMLSPT